MPPDTGGPRVVSEQVACEARAGLRRARIDLNDEVQYERLAIRVSKNPAAKGNTRILAVVLHPRDAKQITIPEPKK